MRPTAVASWKSLLWVRWETWGHFMGDRERQVEGRRKEKATTLLWAGPQERHSPSLFHSPLPAALWLQMWKLRRGEGLHHQLGRPALAWSLSSLYTTLQGAWMTEESYMLFVSF